MKLPKIGDRYRLLKDLPTFNAGEEFYISSAGLVWDSGSHRDVVAYATQTLKKFPNILADWFEEISEEPRSVWDLKDGDTYWTLDLDLEPLEIDWRGAPYDTRLRELGLVFLTKEDLLAEQARNEAKQVLLQDTKGFKPNWEDLKYKFFVYFDNVYGELKTAHSDYRQMGTLYFASYIDAATSISKHKAEWLRYLGIDDECN